MNDPNGLVYNDFILMTVQLILQNWIFGLVIQYGSNYRIPEYLLNQLELVSDHTGNDLLWVDKLGESPCKASLIQNYNISRHYFCNLRFLVLV